MKNFANTILFIMTLSLLWAVPLQAANIYVTPAGAVDNLTNGNCSLVEAILSANTNSSVDKCAAGSEADTIIIPLPPSIFSFSVPFASSIAALPLVTSQIAIQGNGSTIRRTSGASSSFAILYNTKKGTLTLQHTTISGGSNSLFSGGGIINEGNLTLIDSTISQNSGGMGGGIYNNKGSLTLVNSTISGNFAQLSGGGINNTGVLTLNNCTVADNTGGRGGGIFNDSDATVVLTNSTIAGNTASIEGGGISNYASVTLINSILGDSNGSKTCHGTFIDGGGNWIEDNSCSGISPAGTGSVNLGPLTDNGGPTLTRALLSGSPAIDRLPASSGKCRTATDQRGTSRPQGKGCDIGSFEFDDIDNLLNFF